MINAILYLYPNARPDVDFILQDDGAGPYIRFWDAGALGPEPTAEALANAQASGDLHVTITAKIQEINAECDRRINFAVASYPETEKLSFSKQETEARAFIMNGSAPTPMMNALATNRGITKADLANRILAKADAFAAYTGAIIGHRQKLEDQVNAPNADLDAIDPLAGWPALVLP